MLIWGLQSDKRPTGYKRPKNQKDGKTIYQQKKLPTKQNTRNHANWLADRKKNKKDSHLSDLLPQSHLLGKIMAADLGDGCPSKRHQDHEPNDHPSSESARKRRWWHFLTTLPKRSRRVHLPDAGEADKEDPAEEGRRNALLFLIRLQAGSDVESSLPIRIRDRAFLHPTRTSG